VNHFEVDNVNVLNLKIAIFWNVAPYGLVETDRRFRGVCCLHHQGDERLAPKPIQNLVTVAAEDRPDDGGSKHP
jgi:hypothetical protein